MGLSTGMWGSPQTVRLWEMTRKRALQAYREQYGDFGPTFAVEKPGEVEGIGIR